MSTTGSDTTLTVDRSPDGSGGDSSLDTLRAWDPDWTETYLTLSMNPWTNGILPLKTIELIAVALNASCTNLQPAGTRRHIRAALEAGATRNEILAVLKLSALVSLHSLSLGAPLLLEEAEAAGVQPVPRESPVATPACDAVRAAGMWNLAWDPFYDLDPLWTEQFMAVGGGISRSGALTALDIEFLSIAFDASITHMYAPSTRRHITIALGLGATMEEIMEVLKVCVSFGIEALHLGVPILVDEVERLTTPADGAGRAPRS